MRDRPPLRPARLRLPVTPTAVAASQSIEPEQRQAMICDAAYFLSERRGFCPGHELDDWLTAEGEIDRLLAASVRQPERRIRRSRPMVAKQVLFRSAAREKVLRGAAQLADAVRITLGPKSKSVLIQKKWGAPIVCNDGVTIAKEMELEDPEENLGAQMLQTGRRKDR